jgi:hypothetical protein
MFRKEEPGTMIRTSGDTRTAAKKAQFPSLILVPLPVLRMHDQGRKKQTGQRIPVMIDTSGSSLLKVK